MARSERAVFTNMCMISDENGNVLVIDRQKADWPGVTFPGGHVEPGESIVDAVVREMQEETGLTVLHPRLCGIKHFPIDGGRYLVFLFETEVFTGTLRSSGEGEMRWIPRSRLGEYRTVEDLDALLEVMLRPELTEFQYLVSGDDWTVRLR